MRGGRGSLVVFCMGGVDETVGGDDEIAWGFVEDVLVLIEEASMVGNGELFGFSGWFGVTAG